MSVLKLTTNPDILWVYHCFCFFLDEYFCRFAFVALHIFVILTFDYYQFVHELWLQVYVFIPVFVFEVCACGGMAFFCLDNSRLFSD